MVSVRAIEGAEKKVNFATRGRSKAKAFLQDHASKPASTPGGEKIGARGSRKKTYDPNSNVLNQASMQQSGSHYEAKKARVLLGAAAGLTAGSFAGDAVGRQVGNKKYPEAKNIYKARIPKITSMGSAGERLFNKTPKKDKLYPFLPKKTIAAATGVGAATGYSSAVQRKKTDAQIVREQGPVGKRIDPFGINKAYDDQKSLKQQNLAFADRPARKRVQRDYNASYKGSMRVHDIQDRPKRHKEQAIGTAGGAAVGAGIGRYLAHSAKSPKKGKFALVGAAVGALDGAGAGSIPSGLRRDSHAFGTAIPQARKKAMTAGIQRGDVKHVKNKKDIGGWSGLAKSGTSAFGVDHG